MSKNSELKILISQNLSEVKKKRIKEKARSFLEVSTNTHMKLTLKTLKKEELSIEIDASAKVSHFTGKILGCS